MRKNERIIAGGFRVCWACCLMACDCLRYLPIPLDRTSISKRIKETPAILKALKPIALHPELHVELFECEECHQLWQSGREWNFANKEYLFQVPATTRDEWLREPYAQPAAMMIYSAVMSDFFEKNTFEETTSTCRAEGCNDHSVKFSAFCVRHHVESLQRNGRLIKPCTGKMFTPYYVESSSQAS